MLKTMIAAVAVLGSTAYAQAACDRFGSNCQNSLGRDYGFGSSQNSQYWDSQNRRSQRFDLDGRTGRWDSDSNSWSQPNWGRSNRRY